LYNKRAIYVVVMRKANKEIVKSHRSTLFYLFNWILTMIISCAVPFLQCKPLMICFTSVV